MVSAVNSVIAIIIVSVASANASPPRPLSDRLCATNTNRLAITATEFESGPAMENLMPDIYATARPVTTVVTKAALMA